MDRTGSEAHLATEPRLDVLAVALLATAALRHESVEDLIELRVERRLVGEPRELREELADLLALVAGQVESELTVSDTVGRDEAEDSRGRLRAGERECREAGDSGDERDQHARGEPPDPTIARRRGARWWLDRGRRDGRRGRLRLGRAGAVKIGHRVVSPGVHCRPPIRPPSAARRPPPESCFISFCISLNCFTSRLTSGNVVPAPAAMRRRRDPVRIVGSRRSAGVMARMIASVRLSSPRSTAACASSAMPPIPGIIDMIWPIGPI